MFSIHRYDRMFGVFYDRSTIANKTVTNDNTPEHCRLLPLPLARCPLAAALLPAPDGPLEAGADEEDWVKVEMWLTPEIELWLLIPEAEIWLLTLEEEIWLFTPEPELWLLTPKVEPGLLTPEITACVTDTLGELLEELLDDVVSVLPTLPLESGAKTKQKC